MDTAKTVDQSSSADDDLCVGFAESLNINTKQDTRGDEDPEDAKEQKSDETTKEKERLTQRLMTKLTTFDYPPNWILNHEDFDKHAPTVYNIMSDKMLELKRVEEEDGDTGEIKLNAMDVIGKKVIQIFLGIHLQKFDKVDASIKEADEFLDKCRKNDYLDDRHFPGIFHCFHGLKALLITRLPPSASSVSEMQSALAQLETGEISITSDPLARAALLALQFVFTGEIHQASAYKEQAVLARRVMRRVFF